MKRLCWLFIAGFSLYLYACKESNTPEMAAQLYVNYLVHEDADSYARAMARYDSLPENARQQTVKLVKQYMMRENKERGGVKSATVINAVVKKHVANVRISMCYGNGMIEEILLQLVDIDGKWRLV